MKYKNIYVSSLVIASMISPIAAYANGNQYLSNDKYYYSPLQQGTYSQGDYTIEKVSHPTSGAGTLDSIIDPQERGQSYSWSMSEYGDYIYIGTNYNSTYYQYHNYILSSFNKMQSEGTLGKDVDTNKLAENIVDVMFGVDAFDKTQMKDWDPVIIAVHKKTGKADVIYRESQMREAHPEYFPGFGIPNTPKNICAGFRMSLVFKDKIYFVSYGTPTTTLVEINPENHSPSIVYTNTNKRMDVACGVHGLIEHDGEVLMALATDNYDGKNTPGGIIVGSKDMKNWHTVATQKDFDNLPAVMQKDGLNGGGIWDLIVYHDDLYVTIVTDKTDSNGHTNKQGFALYKGSKQGDGYQWQQIVGDQDGSYPFGLGINYSMACNMWVYDDYLYLGTYNDPMLDLAEVPTTGNFEPLYYDLDHSIYLYRMDKDGKIEMVAGKDDNPLFPDGPIGNLGAGLGNHSNQYVWRYAIHDDELYIGTYDTSSITYKFTQLTDHGVEEMSQEDVQAIQQKLQESISEVLGQTDNPLFNKYLEKTLFSAKAGELFQQLSGFVSTKLDGINPVDDYEANLQSYEAFKESIFQHNSRSLEDYSIQSFIQSLNPEEIQSIQGNIQVASLQDVESFKEELYNTLKNILEEKFKLLDKIFYDKTLHNFVYYLGVNYYSASKEPGFDLLVSKDGIHFDALTRNGFGDGNNHGLRTLESTDEGLFMGTANPFLGTQLWKLSTKNDKQVIDETTYSILLETDGHGRIEASSSTSKANENITLKTTPEKGYVFDYYEVVKPNALTIKDHRFIMPESDVHIIAHFTKEVVSPLENDTTKKEDVITKEETTIKKDNPILTGDSSHPLMFVLTSIFSLCTFLLFILKHD